MLQSPEPLISTGTPAFRRACLALFAGGLATFAALYCVQALLPLFSAEFALSPAASSLSLSISTGLLAITMLGSSFVSDLIGPKPTMAGALVISSLLTIGLAVAPGWTDILILRALAGIALSGFPAISLAYLSDELDRKALGIAVGLTIAGNTIGGMGGRLLVSTLADHSSWRIALGVLGALCLGFSILFWALLPPSRRFRRMRPTLTGAVEAFTRHLTEPGLLLLFAEGFVLMGSFVTVYNYLGFRLMRPPFGFSQTAVGFVFLLYIFGTFSSSVAGPVGNRIGRRRMLWASIAVMAAGLALTIPDGLGFVIAGVAVFTSGFFAAHSVASSWVGLRAETARAQATSLYMLTYYMGSSVVGSAGGLFWSHFGWIGVTALIGGLDCIGLILAIVLARVPPPAWLK